MTKSTIANARSKYALDKWYALSDDERDQMQETFHTLMGFKSLGEQGAAELLLMLGTWMNEHDR